MLLVIDVGNTNITLGIFRGEELLGTFRMTTKLPRTSDEYGITLRELVERHGISSTEINAVIVASVVPDVMHSLGSAIIKYFRIKPVVVSAGIRTGIGIVRRRTQDRWDPTGSWMRWRLTPSTADR